MRLENLDQLVDVSSESLDVELKGWIDVENDLLTRAKMAKEIIALANHGGGYILIGFSETDDGVVAQEKPNNYSVNLSDSVNAIVEKYIEPSFHCDVQSIPKNGTYYPVIIVPGGHCVPVRAKKSGPHGKGIQQNGYYIRRPGPNSQAPLSGKEWDELIRRCVKNSREDLLDSIRHILESGSINMNLVDGGLPFIQEMGKPKSWLEESMRRWEARCSHLPKGDPSRMPLGHYIVACQMEGVNLLNSANILEKKLREGKLHLTGWSPFWVPTSPGIRPYKYNDSLECWLPRDGRKNDAAHSDFWRVSFDAKYFLIRGHQEDAMESSVHPPGSVFDVALPIWRVGEILLFFSNMAMVMGNSGAELTCYVEYTGLAQRQLRSVVARQTLDDHILSIDNHCAIQNEITGRLRVRADDLERHLPEYVHELLLPLYEIFGLYKLNKSLVVTELNRLRKRR